MTSLKRESVNVNHPPVVACSQAWISYNKAGADLVSLTVVACSQAWISYNRKDRTMLTQSGQRLRQILAECGYEFTPDEIEDSIDDAIELDRLKGQDNEIQRTRLYTPTAFTANSYFN